MATFHLFVIYAMGLGPVSDLYGGFRARAAGLAHLLVMDAKLRDENTVGRPQLRLIEQVLSLSELCAHLQVTAQTIYDLRSQGRGPRGFRVGRELRLLARPRLLQRWLRALGEDPDTSDDGSDGAAVVARSRRHGARSHGSMSLVRPPRPLPSLTGGAMPSSHQPDDAFSPQRL